MFEAASWALAAQPRARPSGAEQLWQEPLPAVELADRLRRVPLFDFTHVDELFRLARLGRQVRHEQGRTLYERGEAARVDPVPARRPCQRRRGPDGTIEVPAPAALGFEELLEGSPMASTITAAEPSITLSLTADEFLALLSENVELAEGIFRMLIADARLAPGQTLMHGSLSPPDARRTTPPACNDCGRRSPAAAAVEPAARARHRRAIVAAVGDRPAKRPSAAGAEALAKGGEAAILIVLSGSLAVDRRRGGAAPRRRAT